MTPSEAISYHETMNSPFALTCLGLITLAVWIGLALFFAAFLELRRTLQALEALSYQLLESAQKLRNASSQIEDFAGHVRSGWMRAFEVAVGAVQTMWPHRAKAESSSNDNQ